MTTNDEQGGYGVPIRVIEEAKAIRYRAEFMGLPPTIAELQSLAGAADELQADLTTGKLRVVEECGYVPADTWCSVCICKGCGEACSEAGEVEPYPHCPYCTRRIKP